MTDLSAAKPLWSKTLPAIQFSFLTLVTRRQEYNTNSRFSTNRLLLYHTDKITYSRTSSRSSSDILLRLSLPTTACCPNTTVSFFLCRRQISFSAGKPPPYPSLPNPNKRLSATARQKPTFALKIHRRYIYSGSFLFCYLPTSLHNYTLYYTLLRIM